MGNESVQSILSMYFYAHQLDLIQLFIKSGLAVVHDYKSLFKPLHLPWQIFINQKQKQHANVPNILYRPPVFVESAIAKTQQLRHDIETGMEHPVEKYQPYEMIRQLKIAQTTVL